MTILLITLIVFLVIGGFEISKKKKRFDQHKIAGKTDLVIQQKIEYDIEDAFKEYINGKEIPIGGLFDAVTQAYEFFNVNPLDKLCGNGDLKRKRMNSIMEEFSREWNRIMPLTIWTPTLFTPKEKYGEILARDLPDIWYEIARLPINEPVPKNTLCKIKEFYDLKLDEEAKLYNHFPFTRHPITEDNYSRLCNASMWFYPESKRNSPVLTRIKRVPGSSTHHDSFAGESTHYARRLISQLTERKLYDNKLRSLSYQYERHPDYWTRMEAEANFRKLDKEKHPERYAYLNDPHISEPQKPKK